jgi:hypothetical protein
MLFAKKKEPIESTMLKITSGLIIRNNEIPALFIAVSSLFSDSAPNVMMLDIKMARGRAIFTIRALAKSRSLTITQMLNPLPTSSSKYTQINCISKMNMATIKVTRNGPM